MNHSVNMRTFEMCLVFIIFMMGTLLSACNTYELKKFYDEMFKLHNKHRAIHGAPDLIYDEELSTKAMECLELHSLDENDDILMTGDMCYLVYKSKDITRVSAEDVFLSWYNQGQGYDYTNEPIEWSAEHFTQIVWKRTQKLGFAMLEKPGESWFIAAYFPPGNQYCQYIDNVGEPKAEIV